MLREKLATLVWYIKRPALHRELVRRVTKLRMTTSGERARAAQAKLEAQAWCAARVQEPHALLDALNLEGSVGSLSEIVPKWWAEAEESVRRCPVKMGGPAATDLLYHLARHLPASAVIETGVANGWSSFALLAAMHERQGRLISIDMPYAKMENESYVGCAVPDALRAQWELVRLPDRDGLPPAIKKLGTLDLAHHDSDKSYEGRMFVYQLCWPVLRAGGVLMSDDVEDNYAFRDFAEQVGREPLVFYKKPGNYSGALVK